MPALAWRHDRVLARMDPAGYDLVSIDVFDTLLLRRCEAPEDVFERVAVRAAADGVLDAALCPAAFVALRQRLEQRARTAAEAETGCPEVTLDQIYAAFPPRLGDPCRLIALELATEAEACVVNPAVHGFLEAVLAAGRLVVAVSDMYLPAVHLFPLLQSCGVTVVRPQCLYVSCDHGCSKADGGLFRRMLADFPDMAPARGVHIGDDPHGDGAMAARAGLATHLYQPDPRFATAQAREALVLAYPAAKRQTAVRRLAGLAAPPPVPDDYWFDLGATMIGPLVAGFCDWVVERCVADDVRHVVAFMREGAVFAEAVADAAARRGVSLDVSRLSLSREAMLPVRLAGFTPDTVDHLVTRNPFLTVDEFLAVLGLDELPSALAVAAGQRLQALALMPADGTGVPRPIDRLKAHLAQPAVTERVRCHGRAGLARLVAYLRQVLPAGGGVVATVDLGARGTTQAALEAIPEIAGTWHFHHLLAYATRDVFDAVADGARLSVYLGCGGSELAAAGVLYRTPQILEEMLTGLEATTLGFRPIDPLRPDGPVEPVWRTPPVPPAQRRAIAACRAGMAAFRDALCTLMPSGTPASALLGSGLDAWRPLYACLMLPTAEDARRLGDLVYSFNDGSRLSRPLIDDRALAAARSLIDRAGSHCLTAALHTDPVVLPWPQGALARADRMLLERLHRAARPDAGHHALCLALLDQMRPNAPERLIAVGVGGHGGIGPLFLSLAQAEGIAVAAYVDRLPGRLGAALNGIPVCGLEAALALAPQAVALVTLGYADVLAAELSVIAARAGRPVPRVYRFPPLPEADSNPPSTPTALRPKSSAA